MSEENVEVVRACREAFRRGESDVALSAYDPSVELDQSRMPAGGVYDGLDGVRAFFREWFGAWEDLQFDFERLIDKGDEVIQVTRMTGRGRDSGAEVSVRAVDVFTFRNGKIVRHVGYPDAEEALSAMGIAE